MKLNKFIGYSGGALGADAAWHLIGTLHGFKNFVHFRPFDMPEVCFRLRKEKTGKIILVNQDELDYAQKQTRKYLDVTKKQHHLMLRNYYQVINADAVFAVGDWNKEHTNVTGGTRRAVAFGIAFKMPVFILDFDANWWSYSHENKAFKRYYTPVLTPKFCCVGSRRLDQSMNDFIGEEKQNKIFLAISDTYENTIKFYKKES